MCFFAEYLEHRIDENVNHNMGWKSNYDWKTFWEMTCYNLWNWHNKEIHVEIFSRPSNMMNQVYNQIHDYNQATLSSSVTSIRQRDWVLIKWEAPNVRRVKLNSEGARDKRGIAGCGDIIRRTEEEWFEGFLKHIGFCDVYIVKLWGVLEGLQLAIGLGFTKIDICRRLLISFPRY